MCKLRFSILYLLLLLPFLCFPEVATAQEISLYRIETVDGNEFTGELISENEEEVVIKTESLGEITILRENIKSLQQLDPDRMKDEEYWHDNPQATRYLFAPNAIGLRKGQGYYQNTWIFFNNVNYGIIDNFSLGGGIVPVFLFGVSATPVWLLPKVSVPVADGKVHLAAGAMIGGVIGEDTGGAGILYGASTFGNTDRNLSVGLGYGYASRDISDSPMVNISGMYRTGRNFYLISENYLFPATDFTGLTSFGLRWAPQYFAVDFALVRPMESVGGFIGIPWLGVSIPFGR